MESDILSIEELKSNYGRIRALADESAINAGRKASDVTVIAVSKTHPVEMLRNAFDAGIVCFGENYAQEFRDKLEVLNVYDNIEWHFIGHLQTNKVKYLAPYVHTIHTVDSQKLAEEIGRQAIKNNRTINILIQINTSGEESKSGCEPDEAIELAKSILNIEGVVLKGLMTIGTFADDEKIYRAEFRLLREIKDKINSELGINLTELSMGMTHDFGAAIEEGATYVRVGTAIFGSRYYQI